MSVASDGIYARPLSAIEREPVRWLWPGRVPLGMLTLLIGDPGLGKSLLSLDLAARVSRAGGDALILSAEDDAQATIRPRAEAANADLDRLHVVGVRRDGLEDGFLLPDDGETLNALALTVGARLIIVDPLSAHLADGVNSWRDQSVRRALAPLYRLAQQHRCAVLVVGHLNTSSGTNALYRSGGSIGIPAAVRSALLLARDPADPEGERGSRRVLAHVKCNVAEQAESLSCEVEAVEFEDMTAARLRITGTSSTSAADLLDTASTGERSKVDEAADFLRGMLDGGPVSVSAIRGAAEAHGVSWRTVERAKEGLNIDVERVSAGNSGRGRWEWSLGATKTATPISPDWRSCENGSAKRDSGHAGLQDRHSPDMADLSGGGS